MAKRQRRDPAMPWEQLSLQLTSDEQRIYERIRPVVLFGQPVRERAAETQIPERTLYLQVARFAASGMRSLFPADPSNYRQLAPELRELILVLKAEHPPFRPHELATICGIRTGHEPSPHTVKRLLATTTLPTTTRRFAPYHDIPDPFERRRAIVRLHLEGWNKKSIAAYMGVNRSTVYDTLKRWWAEGLAGLPDKSRARRPRVRKVTLANIHRIRQLQQNPLLGAWRMSKRLKQEGILLIPRTCGKIMARNRDVYAATLPPKEPKVKRPMPFQATRRHQYWTVDIRYLDMHQLGGGNIYCISILENYSRAIISSAISRTQDVAAYLIVLFGAIEAAGSPEAIVSDNGSIFRAQHVQQVYQTLGVQREHIAKRKPWQSYIETTFAIQRRMADYDFSQATTWAELQAAHDRWVWEYNHQDHWAHQTRRDARHSPAEVLDWVRGKIHDDRMLHRIFYTLRFRRRVDRMGYVRFRHYLVYGEQGVAGREAGLWLYGDHLTVVFSQTTLSRYHVEYAPDQHHFMTIDQPQVFVTPYRSPQLPLLELDDTEWLKVRRLAPAAPRRPLVRQGEQLALPLERQEQEPAA